jgi:hypothetical protein
MFHVPAISAREIVGVAAAATLSAGSISVGSSEGLLSHPSRNKLFARTKQNIIDFCMPDLLSEG